jgi:hypothetical protein
MKKGKRLILGYAAILIVFIMVSSCGDDDDNGDRAQCVACNSSSECSEGLSCIPFTNTTTGGFLGNACGLTGLVCPTILPAN